MRKGRKGKTMQSSTVPFVKYPHDWLMLTDLLMQRVQAIKQPHTGHDIQKESKDPYICQLLNHHDYRRLSTHGRVMNWGKTIVVVLISYQVC